MASLSPSLLLGYRGVDALNCLIVPPRATDGPPRPALARLRLPVSALTLIPGSSAPSLLVAATGLLAPTIRLLLTATAALLLAATPALLPSTATGWLFFRLLRPGIAGLFLTGPATPFSQLLLAQFFLGRANTHVGRALLPMRTALAARTAAAALRLVARRWRTAGCCFVVWLRLCFLVTLSVRRSPPPAAAIATARGGILLVAVGGLLARRRFVVV